MFKPKPTCTKPTFCFTPQPYSTHANRTVDNIQYPSGGLFRTLVELNASGTDFNYDTSSSFSGGEDGGETDRSSVNDDDDNNDDDEGSVAANMRSIYLTPGGKETGGSRRGSTKGSISSSARASRSSAAVSSSNTSRIVDDDEEEEEEDVDEGGSDGDDEESSRNTSARRKSQNSQNSSRIIGTSVSEIDYSDGPSESTISPASTPASSTAASNKTSSRNTSINSATSASASASVNNTSFNTSVNSKSRRESTASSVAPSSVNKSDRRVSFGGDGLPNDDDEDGDDNNNNDDYFDNMAATEDDYYLEDGDNMVGGGQHRQGSKGSAGSTSRSRDSGPKARSSLSGEIGRGLSPIDSSAVQSASTTPNASGGRGRGLKNKTRNALTMSMISTPGSAEFARGRRLSDSSFVANQDEDEEDDEVATDEEDDSSRSRADGINTVTDTSANGGMVDESSFVDNSFLNAIAPTNPKYLGNDEKAVKKLKKIAHIQHQPYSKKRSRLNPDLHADDAEDDILDGGDSDSDAGDGIRRSRRVTKGRRFAYWKGERPVYDGGTIVDIASAAVTPAKRGGGGGGRKKGQLMKGGKSVKGRIFNGDDDDDDDKEEGEAEFEEKKPKVENWYNYLHEIIYRLRLNE